MILKYVKLYQIEIPLVEPRIGSVFNFLKTFPCIAFNNVFNGFEYVFNVFKKCFYCF